MYRVSLGIHLHFAHHVRGHKGPCISLHGHTWRFEVVLQAKELDEQGFVVDFDDVHEKLLTPCHLLLDHSLALGQKSFGENRDVLTVLGKQLVSSRLETLGNLGEPQASASEPLCGARNESCGGIKLAVFPFNPTSERLAEWLYHTTVARLGSPRVSVASGRVFETLQPVESLAEFIP